MRRNLSFPDPGQPVKPNASVEGVLNRVNTQRPYLRPGAQRLVSVARGTLLAASVGVAAWAVVTRGGSNGGTENASVLAPVSMSVDAVNQRVARSIESARSTNGSNDASDPELAERARQAKEHARRRGDRPRADDASDAEWLMRPAPAVVVDRVPFER